MLKLLVPFNEITNPKVLVNEKVPMTFGKELLEKCCKSMINKTATKHVEYALNYLT